MLLDQGPGCCGTPLMIADPSPAAGGNTTAREEPWATSNLERHSAFQDGGREGTKAKNTGKKEILAAL